MIFKILALLNFMNFINSNELSYNKTFVKNWLSTCSMTKCINAITQCSSTSCSGFPNCKICVANKDPFCYQCSEDIFNNNYMLSINGNRFLPCDQNDAIQQNVCKLFCKDTYSRTIAECKPIESFTACFCYTTHSANHYKTVSNSYGVKAVAPRTGNNEFAVGLSNGEVKVFNNYGELLRSFFTLSGNTINGLVYLSNGDIAVTGSLGTRLYSNGGSHKYTFTSNSGKSVVVLKNGDLAFTNSKSIYIWNPSSSSEKFMLNGHYGTVICLVSLPNGNLASGSADYSIRIWDAVGGNIIKILNGHTDYVRSLILLENGNLASSSDDRQIRIWNINYGFTVKTIKTDHSDYIYALALLPNGKIASGSGDYKIKVWNKDTGLLEKTLSNSHNNNVLQMAVNHYNYLVSVSDDGNIKLWI